jgi:heterodisulfide reductase subunit B
METAFFPGCSQHGLSQEYAHTSRLVCSRLNINLREVSDWNCCGATAAHSLKHDLSLALNVRNLSQAKKDGYNNVVTPCSGCFNRLKITAHEIKTYPEKLRKIASDNRCPFPEDIEVKHLLQLISEEYTPEQIRGMVKKPLKGLKVAAYYGCLLTRPASVIQFDDPDQPLSLDILLCALGADTVTWSYKAECCGGGFNASEKSIALYLGEQILSSAKKAGARAIVAACPLCQINLDARQEEISASIGESYDLPIIYFTQLMALAFGCSRKELQLNKLFVSPESVLSDLNLL